MTQKHPQKSDQIGVLCVNLGTPAAPTPWAIRKFLKEFLWDKRVIDTPRWLWWFILNGIILTYRPFAITKQYQKIWTKNGSPLLVHTQNLQKKLAKQLNQQHPNKYKTLIAMRYGNPSITDALEQFKKERIHNIIILPLLPQYSDTTTASVFDAISNYYKHQSFIPKIKFINHYADNNYYIDALCASIKQHGNTPNNHLVISFHGIPKRYFEKGDPYYCYCHKTARLIKEQLKLSDDQTTMVFQSRFGQGKWLEPACAQTLINLAKSGQKNIDIICPGFAADCLETIEEIDTTYREVFLSHGGKTFNYIPALNDNDLHVQALMNIITSD